MRTLVVANVSSARPAPQPSHSAAILGVTLFALLALWPSLQLQGQSPVIFSSAPVPDRILDRVDDTILTTIPGSTHPAIRNALDNGRLPASTEMGDLVLVLTRSQAQQAALNAFNAAQYDPASPEYHHWLTPEEFGVAYGVSAADLAAVSNWLQDHGFTIQEIPPSRTSIRFRGSSAQVETAFHTQMHSIQSNGVAHIANFSDISIPTAFTAVVAGVKALHNFLPKAQHHAASKLLQNSLAGSLPDSAQWGVAKAQSAEDLEVPAINATRQAAEYNSGGGVQLLVPYDMATIYNYKSLWSASTPITGTGQTIAIAATSNIVLSDVATFRAATGLPAKVPTVIITNSDPGTTALLDDRFENTLDVEWSGGAAPGANIVLVTSSQVSQSTDPLYLSESYIINNNVAKIMSVSYGECELWMGTAGNQEYLNLWQQAYSQGIAVFVSSGDSAAAVCDDGIFNPSTDYAAEYGLSVSGMTSTPYNVSVGGTDFNSGSSNWSATNSSNLSNATGYIPEVPWNDTMTNQFVISNFNGQLGVNYSAEQWANWLLTNEGINGGNYDGLIPPVGGSGGVSNCTTSSNNSPSTCGGGYPKPAWQAGVAGIVSSDKRTVPDVSFFASAGFMGVAYLICDTQPPNYSTPIPCSYPANALDMAVGGTSVSSPVMAGVMALINQKAGTPQGNPNAQLYALAAKQTYSKCSAETTTNSSSCYFNDIDTGTIATPCFGGSVNCTPQTKGDVLGILPGYAATTGYDKATGLGSLNVANVVNGWPTTAASGPAASISPASLNFASTVTGASSATQTVTLTNSGSSALTISGITVSGASATSATPFTQSNACGTTLAANASCAVTVTFKPTAVGAASATLSFADNAPNSPQTVALSGTGAAPATVSAKISPTSLTFPATNAGSASATQTVTFTNTGSTPLASLQAVLTGTYATLFKGASACTGSLAAGSSCIMNFTFNPNAAGSFSATLSVDSSTAGYSTLFIPLTGAGIAAPAASFSPTTLAFPSTGIGASSATQSITLTSSGGAALTLTSIVTGGANPSSFIQNNNCGTVNAGASCTITVTFKPAAAGALSATLSFADNAANSPQAVTLTGTGVAPTVSVSPTGLAFGTTATGTLATSQIVTLKNTGSVALSISGISINGTNSSVFTQTNTCAATLAASASCTVTVTFKPAAASAYTASLSVADNAAASPQAVPLTGTGVLLAPSVTLSASALSFPATSAATAGTVNYSPAQAITLTNSGNGPLTISSIALSGTNPASFTQMNNCPASLPAAASCTALLRFAPTAASSLTATLTFTGNASPTTQSVTLSGSGVSAPTYTLSSSTLAFGSVNSGAISAVQTVTLTNTGTAAPLNLTSIALSGTGAAAFTQVNNCPASLSAGAKCTLLAQFAPTAKSAAAASLTFTFNNPSASAVVALTGTGQ